MYVQVIPVFGRTLQQYLGVGLDRFGLLLGVGMIPAAVACFMAGVLVERWGPRRVMAGSFLGAALGLALAAAGARWSVMLAAVLTITTFNGPIYLCLQSFLIELFPGSRRRMISLGLVSAAVIGMFYPLWAELLMKLARDVPAISFGQVLHIPFGILAAAMMLAGLRYWRRGGAQHVEAPQRDSGHLTVRLPRASVLLALICALHGTCDNALFLWIPRVLDSASYERLTFRPGVVMAGYGLAYTISRGLLILLPERLGRRALVAAPGVIGGAIALSAVMTRNQALTALGILAGSFFWSLELPSALSLLAERDHRSFAKAQALFMLASGAGGFLLTYVMGVVGSALETSQLWALLLIPLAGFPAFGLLSSAWLAKYASAPR